MTWTPLGQEWLGSVTLSHFQSGSVISSHFQSGFLGLLKKWSECLLDLPGSPEDAARCLSCDF